MRFDQILDHVDARVPFISAFHKKLARVPLGIDHPWWVDDPAFDLEFHVRELALPRPGDWRQFCVQLARIHSRPLDLTRPLWELYMIDGLDNVDGVPAGAFALMLRAHHAALDGRASAAIGEILNSDTLPDADSTPIGVKQSPSSLELLARGVIRNLTQPLRSGRVVRRQLSALARTAVSSPPSGVSLTGAPETRFGGPLSPHRVLDMTYVGLDELQAIRRSVAGAKVNDVALAVFGGALRGYLGAIGELPAASLRVMTPVALRARAEQGSIGNSVGARVINLGTDVADPRERLQGIVAETGAAKANELEGPGDLGEALELMPTALLTAASRFAGPLMRRGMSAAYNTVVSNVAFSREHLHLRGATLVRMVGGAPLVEGVGLLNYLTSYAGEAGFGFTACREMMPDPERYTHCIRQSYDELAAI